MSKRFIDTDLFRKPLVRSLQAPYKVLWVYLLCECDHAGVWDVELDVAAMRLGVKLDSEKCLAVLGSAVVPIDGGRKWWLPEFVAFQYGTLNPANKVHGSVLSILSKHGIDPNQLSKEGACKPLASPLQGAKDKAKEMDKAMDVDEERGARIEKFKAKCDDVNGKLNILTAAELVAFVAYWTEANDGGRKFRAELKDVFQHDARMRTWAAKAKDFSRAKPQGHGAPPAPMDRNAPIETDFTTRR